MGIFYFYLCILIILAVNIGSCASKSSDSSNVKKAQQRFDDLKSLVKSSAVIKLSDSNFTSFVSDRPRQYYATLLHCYIVTLLHCYIVKLLHCYIVILLHC